jgi:hypothetical protein
MRNCAAGPSPLDGHLIGIGRFANMNKTEDELVKDADQGVHGLGAIGKLILTVASKGKVLQLINIGLSVLILIVYVVKK